MPVCAQTPALVGNPDTALRPLYKKLDVYKNLLNLIICNIYSRQKLISRWVRCKTLLRRQRGGFISYRTHKGYGTPN